MRSVVVVLPASTCAMMPILRISERGIVRAIANFHPSRGFKGRRVCHGTMACVEKISTFPHDPPAGGFPRHKPVKVLMAPGLPPAAAVNALRQGAFMVIGGECTGCHLEACETAWSGAVKAWREAVEESRGSTG